MTRTVFEKADVIPLVAEVFRELGNEGASMSKITARTGIQREPLLFLSLRKRRNGRRDPCTYRYLVRWLVGAFALDKTRDRFATVIYQYFRRCSALNDESIFERTISGLASV